MTKAKPKPAEDYCAGSGQEPARRFVSDSSYGWCDECGRWRRLIIPDRGSAGLRAKGGPVRLRRHHAPTGEKANAEGVGS